jgi:ribosomal protein S20
MPNTSSAKKAQRVSLKKQKFNNSKEYNIKNSLKALRKNLANGGKKVEDAIAKVYSALDKAAKTNFIPKKRADRKKSRIATMVAKSLAAPKKAEVVKKVAKVKSRARKA